MTWDPTRYGSRLDPVRQSDLSEYAGSEYACPKRFDFRKRADAGEELGIVVDDVAFGPAVLGTAVHEVIAAYLTRAPERILAGELPGEEAVASLLHDKIEDAREGRFVEWGSAKREQAVEEAVAMARGALRSIGGRACEIVAVEAPFLAPLEGPDGDELVTRGTVDLVFRPKDDPAVLEILDWKTGREVDEVVLDRGPQSGMYVHALRYGTFWPGEPNERRFEVFPRAFWIVQTRDFLTYKRGSTKTVTRDEEAALYGVAKGAKVKTSPGDPKGPGWYRSKRDFEDGARFAYELAERVRGIRLRVFPSAIGSHCKRCDFRVPCLETGAVASTGEAALVEEALADAHVPDGLEDFAA